MFPSLSHYYILVGIQMLHKENIPNSDVKDIASNRTGYRHVSETFLGHDDTGYKIRYTGSCCQDGQPHDL